ncbi:unnamed protein product [Medioppia subpectinata]|uniref:Uncharacterized protein n=1 Tax=Medioppia subpectinata TaxID=1979941 RepID=A0A7R9L811_9ACAR|nr:unnamed protein product [Medioppia subpectinata]CAG2116767.1 unnamed protein product [Medioppia subpectinata]
MNNMLNLSHCLNCESKHLVKLLITENPISNVLKDVANEPLLLLGGIQIISCTSDSATYTSDNSSILCPISSIRLKIWSDICWNLSSTDCSNIDSNTSNTYELNHVFGLFGISGAGVGDGRTLAIH